MTLITENSNPDASRIVIRCCLDCGKYLGCNRAGEPQEEACNKCKLRHKWRRVAVHTIRAHECLCCHTIGVTRGRPYTRLQEAIDRMAVLIRELLNNRLPSPDEFPLPWSPAELGEFEAMLAVACDGAKTDV